MRRRGMNRSKINPSIPWIVTLSVLVLAMGLGRDVQAASETVQADAPNLVDVARTIPLDGTLLVQGIALDQTRTVDVSLTRFSVFAPGATIVVEGGPTVAAPDVIYFRGHAVDDPDSTAILAVPGTDGNGDAHGIVVNASGVWMMERVAGQSEMRTRKVDPEVDF